jgi:hypothetical protein
MTSFRSLTLNDGGDSAQNYGHCLLIRFGFRDGCRRCRAHRGQSFVGSIEGD